MARSPSLRGSNYDSSPDGMTYGYVIVNMVFLQNMVRELRCHLTLLEECNGLS